MTREFDPTLSAWLDGELSPDQSAGVQRRLEQDAAARQQLAELKVVNAAVGCLPSVVVSKVDQARMLQRVSARLPKRRRLAPVLPLTSWRSLTAIASIGAAAAALIVGLTVFVLGPAQPASHTSNHASAAISPTTPTSSTTPELPVSVRGNNSTSQAPTTSEIVGTPSDDVLLMLDLLASDVNFEAVASLDDRDMNILGDMTYHNVLADYDRRK